MKQKERVTYISRRLDELYPEPPIPLEHKDSYTLLIAVGAGLVLWPNFPIVRMILLSQVLNGFLLPVILILILILVNRRELMGEWVNSPICNLLAYATVAIVIVLSVTLTLVSG